MYSVDEIYIRLLENISDDYEKTTGFPTADFCKAFAIASKDVYDKALEVENKSNVDNLEGSELTRFVKQRKGVLRKDAKKAIGMLNVDGTGLVNQGDLFETVSGIQFVAKNSTSILGSGIVEIEAAVAGHIGVVGANSIKFMPITIPGIVAANNIQPTYDGYDEESDESLRGRYYLELRKPPTSGNKYHYMLWAKEVVGVGEVRIFSLWNGDNTVKVVIIDSDMEPANSELIGRVQEYIDPEIKGIGEGNAPIGAYCTVASASALPINITAKVKLLDGYSKEQALDKIKMNLKRYLKEIAFKQDYVSYAKLSNEINDSEGIFDYSDLKVNNGISNVAIEEEQVAILGSVVITFE